MAGMFDQSQPTEAKDSPKEVKKAVKSKSDEEEDKPSKRKTKKSGDGKFFFIGGLF